MLGQMEPSTDTPDAKPWYQSVTIISAAVSGICMALVMFGVAKPEQVSEANQTQLVQIALQAGGVISAGIAIWGRIRATLPVGKKP